MSSLPCSHNSYILHTYSPLRSHKPQFLQLRTHTIPVCLLTKSFHRQLSPPSVELRKPLLHLLGPPIIFFLGIAISTRSASASTPISPNQAPYPQLQTIQANNDVDVIFEDEETRAAFESWKSRTYSLTVPLRIVALRSSVPPLWIKNFMQAQGKRAKLRMEFRGSINDIFSELSMAFSKRDIARRVPISQMEPGEARVLRIIEEAKQIVVLRFLREDVNALYINK